MEEKGRGVKIKRNKKWKENGKFSSKKKKGS